MAKIELKNTELFLIRTALDDLKRQTKDSDTFYMIKELILKCREAEEEWVTKKEDIQN